MTWCAREVIEERRSMTCSGKLRERAPDVHSIADTGQGTGRDRDRVVLFRVRFRVLSSWPGLRFGNRRESRLLRRVPRDEAPLTVLPACNPDQTGRHG